MCSTCGTDYSPPSHLLCKIRSDKSKAREDQDMTMKDNIRPSLLNYLLPFCHVSFATELSAPTPRQPASSIALLNSQSLDFSPAKPEGFPLHSRRVTQSLLFKCLKFSLVEIPPKSCGHSPVCFPHPSKPCGAAPRELLCHPGGVGRDDPPFPLHLSASSSELVHTGKL